MAPISQIESQAEHQGSVDSGALPLHDLHRATIGASMSDIRGVSKEFFPAPVNLRGVMSEVTILLSAIDRGDTHAAEQLLPLVYDELRRLAASRIGREQTPQTLQATALVHEAFLRLVDTSTIRKWKTRGHFFGAAAEAMRRILVESARRKHRLKRGGDLQREDMDLLDIETAEPREDLIALDAALDRLAHEDRTAAELVQLRYFAGLTIAEIAEAMDISPRTADRTWAFAKAWLHRALSDVDR